MRESLKSLKRQKENLGAKIEKFRELKKKYLKNGQFQSQNVLQPH